MKRSRLRNSTVRIVCPYWLARQRRRIQSKETGHGRREPMRANNPDRLLSIGAQYIVPRNCKPTCSMHAEKLEESAIWKYIRIKVACVSRVRDRENKESVMQRFHVARGYGIEAKHGDFLMRFHPHDFALLTFPHVPPSNLTQFVM